MIMNEVYNEAYYKEYDVGVAKVDYATSEYTVGFLQKVARRIYEDLHPRSVLDAGCAMGHLVAALRDYGVEAYGIDISEYAISKVRDDIRPYCAVCSLTERLPDKLPKQFDLIISIEVLEHLYAEDGKKAIANLCSYTDQIIISSSPDDFSEPTHVNVQQREYWAKLFAEQGFIDDLNYRPHYLTSYALFFRRSDEWNRQVEDYERFIRITESEIEKIKAQNEEELSKKDRHIRNQEDMLAAAEQEREQLEKIVEDKEHHIQNQERIIEATQASLEKAKREVEDKERHIQNQEEIIETTRKKFEEAQGELTHTSEELLRVSEESAHISAELAHYKEHYFAAINQREELKVNVRELEQQLVTARNDYAVISNSACWKMTKPLRAFLDLLKRVPLFMLMIKALKCLKQNGFAYTWRKIKNCAPINSTLRLLPNSFILKMNWNLRKERHFRKK